jgi:predicted permease
MYTLIGELRQAIRSLRRSPGFFLACVAALGVGVGLTAAMFSIVYGVLMRGLAVPNADRIGVLYRNAPAQGIRRQSLPIQDYLDYRAQQRTFTRLGAYTSGSVNVSGEGPAARLDVAWVSADVFPILGVGPLLGRGIRAEDAAQGGSRVAVLSYGTWQDRYGGGRDAVGRPIRLDGVSYTIVGVMPKGFRFPESESIWLPLQLSPAVDRGAGPFVVTIGLLKPGVPRARAAADVATISQRLAAEYPGSNKGVVATVGTFLEWSVGPRPRRLLATMFGAVLFVLLIGCANVMNLFLDRAVHRRREVGVRIALGASRASLVRGVLLEALVVAAVAIVVGLGLAYAGIAVFRRATIDAGLPPFIQIGLFAPVLLFAAAAGVLAAAVSALLPALRSSRPDVSGMLSDAARGSLAPRTARLSKALVAFEMALSCALLVPAWLLVQSVVAISRIDPGYATGNVLTAGITFPPSTSESPAELAQVDRLEEALGALPGVRAASISSGLPGTLGMAFDRVAVEGRSYARDADYAAAGLFSVTPAFFATLGIRAAAGRVFTTEDRDGARQVAIVTRAFVRRFLDGPSAVGRRIRLGTAADAPWLTIVGVIPDVFGGDPEDPRPPMVLRPFAQAPSGDVHVAVRTQGNPLTLVRSVRAAVAAVDPDLPLYGATSLPDAIERPLWFIRVFGALFIVFGAAALLLALLGLYAVVALSVGHRSRELGIRIALGASRGSVVRMILAQGAAQVAMGLVPGLAIAAAAAPMLSAVLLGVKPHDPLAFAAVGLVLAAAGTLACAVPAHRAGRVDPVQAIRQE